MDILLLILHVISAGVLVGIVTLAIVLSFAKEITLERAKIYQLIGKIGFFAAGLVLISGIGLYLQEPDEFNKNIFFWVKIGLFVVDGIIATQIVDRKVKDAVLKKNGQLINQNKVTRWFWANLIIIISIITIGVFLVES